MAGQSAPKARAAATKPLSLQGKLAAIQAQVHYVEKTGKMDASGKSGRIRYDFMQEHGLLELLKPLWREHNLFVAGQVAPASVEHQGNKCYLEWELTVFDGDSDQTFTFRCAGEGQDQGDKATAKAMTGANKYALQKVFQVATEAIDDMDNTASTDLAEQQAAQQQEEAGQAEAEAQPQPKSGPRAAPSQRKLESLRKTAVDAMEAGHVSQQRIQATLQGTFEVEKITDLATNEAAEKFATWLTEELRGSAAAKA
jgi:hypothetical protein